MIANEDVIDSKGGFAEFAAKCLPQLFSPLRTTSVRPVQFSRDRMQPTLPTAPVPGLSMTPRYEI
jgi:hypothetical protein